MFNNTKIPVFCVVFLMILTALAALSFNAAGSGGKGNWPTLGNAGVTPSSGDSNTVFYFYITYTDADGDMPLNMDIIIDNNWYKMTTNDTDPTRGMYYFYSTKLSTGNHSYYYSATNMNNETVRAPATGTYNLYVGSSGTPNKPLLYNHKVSPERPKADETINFTVQYKDPNNVKPNYVRLHLRLPDDNNSYKNINMEIIGTTYSSGVTCYVTLSLSNGTYYYHFSASHAKGTVTDPSGGGDYKLVIGDDSQNNFPALYGGAVSPGNGSANKTLFTYHVIYQDGSFGSAKKSLVYIDGTSYTMSEIDEDSGSLGVYYEYNTTLPAGIHNFYFLFSNETVEVRLPVSGTFTGPYVDTPGQPNNPPKVTLSVSPLSGPVNTVFYFNATGTDPDRDPLTYSWKFSDNYNSSNSPNIVRKMTKAGNYTVTVTVSDPGGKSASATASFTVTGSNNPPPKNSPPIIVCNLESTNTVKKGTIMNISAADSYDPDGDPLTFRWDIMSMNSINPPVYLDPYFMYDFNIAGDYTFELQVSDSKDTAYGKYLVQCVIEDNIPKDKPVALAAVTVDQMMAIFSAEKSYDPDGYIVKYSWEIDRNTFSSKYVNYTYKTEGYKTAKLTVTDNDGLTDMVIIGFYVSTKTNDSNQGIKNSEDTYIASHVSIDYNDDTGASLTTFNAEPDFIISIIDTGRNYLKFEVKSNSKTGKMIVVDLINIFEPDVIDQIEINMDNSEIKSTDLENILLTSGDETFYHLIQDIENFQLLVYIHEFSAHIIEVKVKSEISEEQADQSSASAKLWISGGIMAVVAVIVIIVVFMQIKKKKKIEYYNDFRVAEEKVYNGERVNKDDSESVDWDEYI
ncbi:MAG: PKD domain-containing protein [Thermoplasmata archaeon]|nr:MAG: PKD domain-containing protein [Thermoplasmata archaeon]